MAETLTQPNDKTPDVESVVDEMVEAVLRGAERRLELAGRT